MAIVENGAIQKNSLPCAGQYGVRLFSNGAPRKA